MNSISLASMPLDCLMNIVKHSNQYDLLIKLCSVAKAFREIAVVFFQNNPVICKNLYISKINGDLSNEQKIMNVSLLLKHGIAFDQKLIPQCENMYGLSPELKALLQGEPYNPNKKRKLND